ncbi:hypothetical protein IW262DRAFT_1043090 [Armillaria fumosa]|nr:hypothetical protein IW262DRAFT_1043090 [Armillaria fumosa]
MKRVFFGLSSVAMIYRQLLTAILDKGWYENAGHLRLVGIQARPSGARTITCWKGLLGSVGRNGPIRRLYLPL